MPRVAHGFHPARRMACSAAAIRHAAAATAAVAPTSTSSSARTVAASAAMSRAWLRNWRIPRRAFEVKVGMTRPPITQIRAMTVNTKKRPASSGENATRPVAARWNSVLASRKAVSTISTKKLRRLRARTSTMPIEIIGSTMKAASRTSAAAIGPV